MYVSTHNTQSSYRMSAAQFLSVRVRVHVPENVEYKNYYRIKAITIGLLCTQSSATQKNYSNRSEIRIPSLHFLSEVQLGFLYNTRERMHVHYTYINVLRFVLLTEIWDFNPTRVFLWFFFVVSGRVLWGQSSFPF